MIAHAILIQVSPGLQASQLHPVQPAIAVGVTRLQLLCRQCPRLHVVIDLIYLERRRCLGRGVVIALGMALIERADGTQVGHRVIAQAGRSLGGDAAAIEQLARRPIGIDAPGPRPELAGPVHAMQLPIGVQSLLQALAGGNDPVMPAIPVGVDGHVDVIPFAVAVGVVPGHGFMAARSRNCLLAREGLAGGEVDGEGFFGTG